MNVVSRYLLLLLVFFGIFVGRVWAGPTVDAIWTNGGGTNA